MPDGVSYEGVFGERREREAAPRQAMALAYKRMSPTRTGGGFLANDVATVAPPPSGRSTAQASPPEAYKRPVEADERSRRDPDEPSRGKLHAALASVYQRHLQGNLKATPREARFVENGKVSVEIWLTDAAPETLAQLHRLGFELLETPKVAKILAGRIDIAKLMDLAKLSGVRSINPLAR
jgi:hypothetical protein